MESRPEVQQKPRKRFAALLMQETPRRCVPKVRDLQMHEALARKIRPPQEVLDLLRGEGMIIGVDVETHDWNSNGGSKGRFGHYGCYTRRATQGEEEGGVGAGLGSLITTCHVDLLL